MCIFLKRNYRPAICVQECTYTLYVFTKERNFIDTIKLSSYLALDKNGRSAISAIDDKL